MTPRRANAIHALGERRINGERRAAQRAQDRIANDLAEVPTLRRKVAALEDENARLRMICGEFVTKRVDKDIRA